jgi:hypothetical protein
MNPDKTKSGYRCLSVLIGVYRRSSAAIDFLPLALAGASAKGQETYAAGAGAMERWRPMPRKT